MIDVSPTPSLLLRAIAIFAKWALRLLVVAWTALAIVWGGLHFLIVPRIAEFRPWLEQQASLALGIPVRIGDVSARSNGLVPSIEFREVQLLDPLGRTALRLPSVQVALSPRSVLGGGLEQLYIDSPVLDVRRTADGRLWVAGLVLADGPSTESPALNWLFSQYELAIRKGTVTWTDERRGAPPLTLTDLDWVLRNRLQSHAMRLDATPPPGWGQRLNLTAIFRQPLLSRHNGQWQDWSGQLYANFAEVDLTRLQTYADLGVEVTQGHGALRAWVEVQRGTPTGATVDLALQGVDLNTRATLDPLQVAWVAGRLTARQIKGGYAFATQALEFDTADGLHWPGGNLQLKLLSDAPDGTFSGDLAVDQLDLAALTQIAQRLPLNVALHAQLAELQPGGKVQKFKAHWQGAAGQLAKYGASGRVEQLAIAPRKVADGIRPGFRGADVDFDLNQAGGKATVALRAGQLQAPAIFEEALIPLDQLSGKVQWKIDGDQVSVSLPQLRFGNADAAGELQLKWRSGAFVVGSAGAPDDRLPGGVLELQGSLSRAELNRVYRYLPLGISKNVREYVRAAIQAGNGSAVRFKVRGNVYDFPYNEPGQGEFQIAAKLQNASYSYMPDSWLLPGTLPWPALAQLSADFSIDRSTLQVRGARATAVGSNGVQIARADSVISNLYGDTQISVNAEGRGQLSDLLGVVNGSPLGPITRHTLARASASGPADFRFKLGFGLAAVERISVQGAVTLGGNDLQVSPDLPPLTRARGAVAFSETGFSVAGVQARAVGGEVRIDGGLSLLANAPGTASTPLLLRLQGTASAEGLQQTPQLGIASRLAQFGTGTAAYSASVDLRAPVLTLLVNSDLRGMALSLPEPFRKTADQPLPLRVETSALAAQSQGPAAADGTPRWVDTLQVDVQGLASVTYVRDLSGAQPRVLRGAIAVGLAADESAPLPERGVIANIQASTVDLAAWSQVLRQGAGAEVAVAGVSADSAAAGMSYLPTSLVLRAQSLLLGGRQFKQVLVGGSREGQLWRANLDATELNGYLEYRQPLGPSAGRLYARLSRLSIAQGTAQDVENLLDEQPESIPALDIVVEDFELRGKKLGRVEVEAVNLVASGSREVAREWRMNRFDIITPEATLKASGNWTDTVELNRTSAPRSVKERRRTAMKFSLDIADAGTLLSRFGMADVVLKGQGKIQGRVGWLGSPITLDYGSMGGDLNINIESGQFLKTEPGIAKLLGVLSLQSLPRRLALDFRDVFSEGFSFDFLRGDVEIDQGIAHTNNLQMKGVNAAVLMEGQADIAKETQTIKVLVVPEIDAGSASLIASTINPLVGLSTFLAQWILRRPLMDAATQEFLVDGTWVDPRVTKVDIRPVGAVTQVPGQ